MAVELMAVVGVAGAAAVAVAVAVVGVTAGCRCLGCTSCVGHEAAAPLVPTTQAAREYERASKQHIFRDIGQRKQELSN